MNDNTSDDKKQMLYYHRWAQEIIETSDSLEEMVDRIFKSTHPHIESLMLVLLVGSYLGIKQDEFYEICIQRCKTFQGIK